MSIYSVYPQRKIQCLCPVDIKKIMFINLKYMTKTMVNIMDLSNILMILKVQSIMSKLNQLKRFILKTKTCMKNHNVRLMNTESKILWGNDKDLVNYESTMEFTNTFKGVVNNTFASIYCFYNDDLLGMYTESLFFQLLFIFLNE